MQPKPKESVVLYPSVGMGHLIPMAELAKLFASKGFSVTIIVVELPNNTSPKLDSFISRTSSAFPSIFFHRILPKLPPSPAAKNPLMLVFEALRLSNCHLLEFLRSRKSIKALVLDMFCAAALDVANELALPCYIFFPSGASALAFSLLFPTLRLRLWDGNTSPVHFHGLPPIPVTDLPPLLLHRNEASEAMVSLFESFPLTDGIIINTFESLEERAVEALVDGMCVPGRVMPPIYCIGPLVADDANGERHECLTWLDEQPEKSVVFLCFGSMGSFSVEQLREMAKGLEMSGRRFLWVVRSPPSGGPEPNLEALLPEGFLKRTERKGMVVRSWAPQMAVLGHPSVGVFVSHCGWNSALEAVVAGVPMIAWPLYAEQRMNKVFLVEAKIAVAIEGYDEGLVTAEGIERKIKLVMESEFGKILKEESVAMKEKALAALEEDGSSIVAWKKLVVAVRQNGAGQEIHQ